MHSERAFLEGPQERLLKWLAVGLISLVAFEALAVATAMPTVVRSLEGQNLYALAMGITMATQLIATALAGPWSDTRSPQSCLYAGVALFVLGLTICTLSPSMYIFVLGRGIQGFGGGLSMVPLYTIIGNHVHPSRQPPFFAAFAAAWVLPALIGPGIAGLVVQYASWRLIFGFVPVVFLLAVPVLVKVTSALPRTEPAESEGSTKRRMLLAIGAGISVALLQVMSGTEPDSFTPPIFLVIAVSAVLTFAFMKPLLPVGTFSARRGLPSTVLLRGLANGAFIGVETFLPLLLQLVHGWEPAGAGLVLTVGSITWAIGSAVSGRIADREVRAKLPVVGTVIQLVGSVVTFAGVFEGVPGAVIIIGWTITGLGIGLVYPTMTVHALAMTRTKNKGKTSSALQMADTLGAAFCVAAAGIAYALVLPNLSPAFAAAVGLMIVILVMAVPIARRTRPYPGSDEEVQLLESEQL
ncbi:MFS transporter [Actinomycetaceae bacterium MB13-C1-2]|nr:MFS transporter [Actinomycetaceae bacterium MB13-C1-2]